MILEEVVAIVVSTPALETRCGADPVARCGTGGAPKITYNQDIEDYLQGFCNRSDPRYPRP